MTGRRVAARGLCRCRGFLSCSRRPDSSAFASKLTWAKAGRALERFVAGNNAWLVDGNAVSGDVDRMVTPRAGRDRQTRRGSHLR